MDDKMNLLTLDGWAAFARQRRGDELELRGVEEEENGGPSRAVEQEKWSGGEGREMNMWGGFSRGPCYGPRLKRLRSVPRTFSRGP